MKKSSNLSASTRAFVSWFTVTRFKTTTLMIMVCLGFMQCNTDEGLESSKLNTDNPKITTRTCDPGSYSIINGRIAFDDSDEYAQTMDFLSCATKEDIEDWSEELELSTAGKVFRNFIASIDDEELDDEEFLDLIEFYEGKIIFTGLLTEDIDYRPLYNGFQEICNMDGEFQVGDAIIKVTENKIISITDVFAVDPSEVDDGTVTDTTDGLFVYNIDAAVFGGACCPSSDEETNLYGSNPRKRLWNHYRIVNASIVEYFGNGQFRFTPMIKFIEGTKSQKKGFLGIGWKPYFGYLLSDVDIEFTHNYTADISSPVNISYNLDAGWSWGYETTAHIHATRTSFALNRPPSTLTVCVSDVYALFTNYTTTQDVEIECL